MTLQQIPEDIRSLLLAIKNEMLRNSWVEKVVLYGSYAVGTFTPNSDVDIAVFVSDDSCCGLRQYLQLNRICRSGEFDIQIQIFSIDELADPCGIVEEVVEHGIDITAE